MKLEEVKPWGRSLSEYLGMFDLTAADLQAGILGCGDGPASFNAEATARGGRVVSVDPIYAFSAAEIRARVAETYETIIRQVRERPDRYCWTRFRDPDDLGRARLTAMEKFAADLEPGRAQGRYRTGALPELPFATDQFAMSVCSHLLFLYTEQLPLEFHLAALRELLRVSREVRIFPLLDLNCETSAHLGPVVAALRAAGHRAEVVPVPYEFQKGGDRMLRVRRKPPKGERL